MKNSEILKIFIPFVDFLGEALGPKTEVVLHDVSKPKHSIIAIKNGALSGRTIGHSLTDFALNVNNTNEYKTKNQAIHYKATANGITFLSSTYYIKNEDGNLIGMLCLNTDTRDAKDFLNFAKNFINSLNFGALIDDTNTTLPVSENLNTPINTLIEPLIENTITKYGITPDRMTREERIKIVKELDDQGVTSIKGGISEIANQLNLSESTVYRYINTK